MGEFSHFDQHGNAVMVDVTKKKETTRTAIAQGKIKVNDEIFEKVWNEKVYEANNKRGGGGGGGGNCKDRRDHGGKEDI